MCGSVVRVWELLLACANEAAAYHNIIAAAHNIRGDLLMAD